MYAFIFVTIMVWIVMWLFLKFMYPKPPREFMPKAGDIVTPRDCDFCGYPLAEYRGIIETKPDATLLDETLEIQNIEDEVQNKTASTQSDPSLQKAQQQATLTRTERKAQKQKQDAAQKRLRERQQAHKLATTWFFCNQDHQARFHAGETYRSPSQDRGL